MAEFKEYPKVIHVGRGTFTVNSAEEEAQYRAPAPVVPKPHKDGPDPNAPVAQKNPVAPKTQAKQPKTTKKLK